jgi:hypothetical protein
MGNYSLFEPRSWHLNLWHCLAPSKLVMKWSLYIHTCQILSDASIASDFNVPSSDVRWTWFVERMVTMATVRHHVPATHPRCVNSSGDHHPNDKNCPMYLNERTSQELSHGGPFLSGYTKWFLDNKPRMLNQSYHQFSLAFRGSRQVFRP